MCPTIAEGRRNGKYCEYYKNSRHTVVECWGLADAIRHIGDPAHLHHQPLKVEPTRGPIEDVLVILRVEKLLGGVT